jgi:hypothetical protein
LRVRRAVGHFCDATGLQVVPLAFDINGGHSIQHEEPLVGLRMEVESGRVAGIFAKLSQPPGSSRALRIYEDARFSAAHAVNACLIGSDDHSFPSKDCGSLAQTARGADYWKFLVVF